MLKMTLGSRDWAIGPLVTSSGVGLGAIRLTRDAQDRFANTALRLGGSCLASEFRAINVSIWPLNDVLEGCYTSYVYLLNSARVVAANRRITQADTSMLLAAAVHGANRVGGGCHARRCLRTVGNSRGRGRQGSVATAALSGGETGWLDGRCWDPLGLDGRRDRSGIDQRLDDGFHRRSNRGCRR